MTAATVDQQMDTPQAEERRVPLPLRNDTFFGVCEAVGRDIGFNPNWLRVVFGVLILFSPVAAVAGYVSLGVFVGVAHLLFPAASLKAAKARQAEIQAADDNEESEERMAA